MKHASNLLQMHPLKSNSIVDEMEPISEETANIVNLLFREMQSIFPAFKQAWPTQSEFNRAKKNWVKAFISVELNTVEQLRFGLKQCRLSGSHFAPSVGEFIEWCSPKPEDIGLLPMEEAYNLSILINRQFSDHKPTCNKTYTVIRHVIDQIGPMQYRELRAELAFKTFERYYTIACKQFIEGKLKEIPKALTETQLKRPEDKKRSEQARLKAMDAIRNMGIPVTVKEEQL